MTIDLTQFRNVYFEESFEGLEVMESGLLELSSDGPSDPELVHTIFRAAHSIKGGAGTFGLQDVGALTHVMETLLDEFRSDAQTVNQPVVDALLAAVDCVREMFALARSDSSDTPEGFQKLMGDLEAFLTGSVSPQHGPSEDSATTAGASESAPDRGWCIDFHPSPELLRSGNDPLRLLRCLRELGDVELTIDTSRLPSWNELDPEVCYADWQVQLRGSASRDDVTEVFEWVEDLAEIEIEPLADPQPTTKSGVVPAPESEQRNERTAPARRSVNAESGSIRVNIDKVDALINMVGELVITQSMLSQVGQEQEFDDSHLTRLREGLVQLERNTRELQESVMRIRMVPMSFAFGRVPRIVHDLATRLDKTVGLEVSGEQTELDKTVMERLHDPLVHIVRNSLDHGLEIPEERRQAGKPERGRLSLDAYHHGGNIVIEVADDGRGLNLDRIRARALERGIIPDTESIPDEKAAELIFAPGFSTAEAVTDVSGRGVGMDVVKRNIDALGGSVSVRTEAGRGTTIAIRLPLTLAILDGQTICVGEEKYILPLNSIVETIQLRDEAVNRFARGGEMFQLRDEHLRILRLAELFDVSSGAQQISKGLLVVVEGGGEKLGLFVDELLAQQQIVIKSLETNYRKVDGVSGATILGDGRVALILDVPGLIRIANAAPIRCDPSLIGTTGEMK